MKTAVKTLAFALFAGITTMAITSCGSKASESEHDHQAGDHEHTYACPMHAEVVGEEGETCSKCGMKLELVSDEKASNTNSYFMAFNASPALEAGKASLLSFTPTIKGNESEMVPLDIQHDKKMHLIVVSKDLSYFDHIHPEFQPSGSSEIWREESLA